MPTYDYVCRFCDHAFEYFQGINEPLLRKCPECGRRGLKRLIGSGAGVVFKGSGFYETDYKRPSRGKDGGKKDEAASKPKTDGSGAGKADGKGGGKTDSTPADKGGKPSKDKPA